MNATALIEARGVLLVRVESVLHGVDMECGLARRSLPGATDGQTTLIRPLLGMSGARRKHRHRGRDMSNGRRTRLRASAWERA